MSGTHPTLECVTDVVVGKQGPKQISATNYTCWIIQAQTNPGWLALNYVHLLPTDDKPNSINFQSMWNCEISKKKHLQSLLF